MSSSCACRSPLFQLNPKLLSGTVANGFQLALKRNRRSRSLLRVCEIRASMVDSPDNPSNFAKRAEQAWLISQQPTPNMCSTCHSNGNVECEWCRGTGFFILGDNMLCEVPSKNTTCVICSGKGWMRCADCKGTGFRAKWLEEPPPPPISKD